MINELLDYIAFVHTLSFKTKDNVYDKREKARIPEYVNKVIRYSDSTLFVVNPNKLHGELHNAKEFRSAMQDIMDDLGIRNIRFTRMDFSFNSYTEFDELYKINHTVKELYSFFIKSTNSYYTSGDDHKKRSTQVNCRSSSLEIYDKYLESKGQSPYKTRIEFRFYRGKPLKGIEALLEHVQTILCKLPSFYEQLVDQQLKYLCNAYEREKLEKREGRILLLSAFVTKYADSFFSYDLAQRFYKQYRNGTFKSWLCQYRKRGHVITFYKKKDIREYIAILHKKVHQYVKE